MGIEVRPEELREAAGELEQHAAGFDGYAVPVDDATGARYGHVELADWVAETGTTVETAVGRLVEASGALAAALRDQADDYERTDQAVADQLWPGASPFGIPGLAVPGTSGPSAGPATPGPTPGVTP